MAVPATQGKQCKYLEEMEIGDYIRCTYTATEANVAGEFSDLGGFVDTYETQQQQVDGEGNPVVDADGNPVMETVTKQYEEIPIFTYVSAATIPIRGCFYFLKVDKGLLVADRCVQNYVSAVSLNQKNYLMGVEIGSKFIRVLSQSEWERYLVNGDLNGCIVKQDVDVWHVKNYPISYNDPLNGNPGTVTYYHMVEYISGVLNENIKTEMNINGTSYNVWYHVEMRPYTLDYGINYMPKYQNMLNVSCHAQASYVNNRFIHVYANLLFRPAIEYIDNPNSKTIYY